MRRVLTLITALALLLSLSTCAAVPGREQSPGPGEAAAAPAEGDEGDLRPWREAFTTDNGLISVEIDVPDPDPIPASMPVLRVRPAPVTMEQLRRVARVCFDDAPLYEYSEELSRAEVAEQIALWEQAVSDEAIRADHGQDLAEEYLESVRRTRREILDYYRNAYADARETVEPVPCQWRFWPMEHYGIHGHDYAGTDPSWTDEVPYGVSAMLRATVTAHGIPYTLWGYNSDTDSYVNHSISVFPLEPRGVGGPGTESYEEWLRSVALYSAAPPTEAELAAIVDKAVDMARDMGLGDWRFSARAEDLEDRYGEGFAVFLQGEPLYEGVPVVHQNQLSDMRGGDPATQHYYYEDLSMRFRCDGTLLELHYTSPLQLVETVEAAAPLMDESRAREAALAAMRAWEYGDLFAYSEDAGDPAAVTVDSVSAAVKSLRVGYARVKDGPEDYLLIPSLSLMGQRKVLGWWNVMKTEQPYELWENVTPGWTDTLLALDLRSGETIAVHNPVYWSLVCSFSF